MTWDKDGWCIIGTDQNGDGIGEPVLNYRRPAVAEQYKGAGLKGVSATATTTGFTGTSIPLNWQWEANPKFHWFMLNPSLGCLRLNCIKNPEGWKNLRDTPNILAQKVVGPSTEFTTKLVYRPSYDGERVGVVLTGRSYSTIELNYDGQNVSLVRRDCIDANKGAEEKVLCSTGLEKQPFVTVWIRVKVGKDCLTTFSYSFDGKKFKTFGPEFKGREGDWIGAKIGYFATATIQKNDGGSVEVY